MGQRKGIGNAEIAGIERCIEFLCSEPVMTCAMTGIGFRGGAYWIRILTVLIGAIAVRLTSTYRSREKSTTDRFHLSAMRGYSDQASRQLETPPS
jgi:hypothetical protein